MHEQAKWAETVARELYGIKAETRPLAGERDDNFRLRDESGRDCLLKISPPGEEAELLEFQDALLQHLKGRTGPVGVQTVHPTLDGDPLGHARDPQGRPRLVRLMDFLPGRLLVEVRPHGGDLLESLGASLARVDQALQDLTHPMMERRLKWDLARPQWIGEHLEAVRRPSRRKLVESHLQHFRDGIQPRLEGLRRSVIHGDANDYNILVSGHGYDARVSALIDFGDATCTATVCDLAIALAYAILDKPHPIETACRVTHGYHSVLPLLEEEVEVLFPLVLTRLCVSVVNSALLKKRHPEDDYITVSERPAWEMLERLRDVSQGLVLCRLRAACGFTPHPRQPAVTRWLRRQGASLSPLLGSECDLSRACIRDLSVASPRLEFWSPRPQDWRIAPTAKAERGDLPSPLPDHPAHPDLPKGEEAGPEKTDAHQRRTREDTASTPPGAAQGRAGRFSIAVAGYGEVRPARDEDLARQSFQGREWPSVQLGIEIFATPGSQVHTPLPGRRQRLNEPLIVEHRTSGGERFFSLYRGLRKKPADPTEIGAGGVLGQVGPSGSLQVQLCLDWADLEIGDPRTRDGRDDSGRLPVDEAWSSNGFPVQNTLESGSAYPSQREAWMSICPDPNLLVGVSGLNPIQQAASDDLLARRRRLLGPNLSLAYRRPLHIVRGAGQYLYDAQGRRYLDIYNNVPHVGHSHPRVVEAGCRQMALLNTNTRYLNESTVRYAERLAATFPEPLKVCYFTASGSEATELALRLARAHTGQHDLIVSDGAYHGHTTTLIDISPYKAEGPGGRGLPEWVHKAPLPDTFRGLIRADREDPETGRRYAAFLQPLIEEIRGRGRGLCAFMIESIPSCGGQIVLPRGYLKQAYRLVREAGGVCIADEVQVGFGRVGTHMWGFQTQDVVPDIVALGKPIANGHPLAAVITTPEIAASFDTGMEFFSTYGGNTVSCAVALEVLRIIQEDSLQEHAQRMGLYLHEGLTQLQSEFPVLGDVRGLGLFRGIELVDDPQERTPGARQATYLSNRLCQNGILTGIDGPQHNVLKLRPPLPFDRPDADFFLETLKVLLGEDGAQAS
ncbi:MAG TPA: aminotransferase class III-fold pyridoxal phosphate-dependent enzyme [Acidobacteriota bacterium]|nr:aminotransferase class III-fold pyridoxal phosphate-dependent enzyme [Acidobacteriota bacterium]